MSLSSAAALAQMRCSRIGRQALLAFFANSSGPCLADGMLKRDADDLESLLFLEAAELRQAAFPRLLKATAEPEATDPAPRTMRQLPHLRAQFARLHDDPRG